MDYCVWSCLQGDFGQSSRARNQNNILNMCMQLPPDFGRAQFQCFAESAIEATSSVNICTLCVTCAVTCLSLNSLQHPTVSHVPELTSLPIQKKLRQTFLSCREASLLYQHHKDPQILLSVQLRPLASQSPPLTGDSVLWVSRELENSRR